MLQTCALLCVATADSALGEDTYFSAAKKMPEAQSDLNSGSQESKK